MRRLRERAASQKGQAVARTAARELGIAALCAAAGKLQVPVQGLRADVLAAIPGHFAAQASDRTIQAECFCPTL
jgi:hypothetical protein